MVIIKVDYSNKKVDNSNNIMLCINLKILYLL